MDTVEKLILDEIEGVGHGYTDHTVSVVAGHGILTAFTYYPCRLDGKSNPFDWYMAFVLHGARENNLPIDYLSEINRVKTSRDPDENRRQYNLAILENRK